jgi:hypothetical protein
MHPRPPEIFTRGKGVKVWAKAMLTFQLEKAADPVSSSVIPGSRTEQHREPKTCGHSGRWICGTLERSGRPAS